MAKSRLRVKALRYISFGHGQHFHDHILNANRSQPIRTNVSHSAGSGLIIIARQAAKTNQLVGVDRGEERSTLSDHGTGDNTRTIGTLYKLGWKALVPAR